MYKKVKKNLIRHKVALSSLVFTLSFDLLAALPVKAPPSTAPTVATDWLGLIKGYFKDAGIILGLAMAVVAFIWISWINVAKFNEARKGKADWGEVGLTAAVSAVIMIFITYFLNEAATVF